MDKNSEKTYGDRVRVRSCGMCWADDKLLLVNHRGLYQHDFWAPPGGGIDLGLAAAAILEKEFMEETGLVVRTGQFLFACEFIHKPLHAIELYFEVSHIKGKLSTGFDPEMGADQIITDAKFFTEQELTQLPAHHKHGLFGMAQSVEKIRGLRGYLKI